MYFTTDTVGVGVESHDTGYTQYSEIWIRDEYGVGVRAYGMGMRVADFVCREIRGRCVFEARMSVEYATGGFCMS